MKMMIDLHSHFFPGIDDGAKNAEVSLEMLRDSFEQGVELCAATPHAIVHRKNDIGEFLEMRRRSFESIKPMLDEGCPRIIQGAEVYLDNDINLYPDIASLALEGTDYIMLEFPVEGFNPRWAEWVYNLNRKGLKVLVAHVDRYGHKDKLIADFKGLDVKYQINASRFEGLFTSKVLLGLLEYDIDYIVSSDMHNMKSRRCNMAKAYETAKKKFPNDADAMFFDNAKRLLENR